MWEWYKIWYTGNGGIECEKRYARLRTTSDHSDMEDQVCEAFGSLSYSVRSVHWKKVKYLPDDVVNDEIGKQRWIIDNGAKNARIQIAALEKMRKPKKVV